MHHTINEPFFLEIFYLASIAVFIHVFIIDYTFTVCENLTKSLFIVACFLKIFRALIFKTKLVITSLYWHCGLFQ